MYDCDEGAELDTVLVAIQAMESEVSLRPCSHRHQSASIQGKVFCEKLVHSCW